MQSQVLSDEDVGSIHEATRKVLAKTGVGFKDSPQALEIFRTAGCRVDDERVHFSHEVITEGLARIPDRDSLDYYNHFLGFTGPVSLGQGDVSFGLIDTSPR